MLRRGHLWGELSLRLPFCDLRVSRDLSFVVPGVVDISALRSCITLCKQYVNSACKHSTPQHSFRMKNLAPHGGGGTFSSNKKKAAQQPCVAPVDIRRTLSTMVVHRSKHNAALVNKENAAKEKRRRQLQQDLKSHSCVNRASGKLAVPLD